MNRPVPHLSPTCPEDRTDVTCPPHPLKGGGNGTGQVSGRGRVKLSEDRTGRAARRKARPAPSVVAHPCVVLAVDPGETSGWALLDRGRLVASGTCDVFAAGPPTVVAAALALGLPVVAVVERPFRVRWSNQTGIGTADRIWRHHLAVAGLGRRIVRVYPATWRARVLGPSWAVAKREAVREREGIVAAAELGRTGVHPDEAAAVCIGRWGAFAGEVREKLPKRLRGGGA